MNNRYFQLSDKEKKIFRLKLLLSSLFLILLIGLIIIILSPKFGYLIIVPIGMMILIIAPFFDVPSSIENGHLKYHSLFLLAEQEKDGIITIHGGTLFDYYFVFQNQKEMSKQERTKLVLIEYLKGLKNLVENTNGEFKIQGTSYIINERTANKLGLRKVTTNGYQALILLLNYIPLMLSISLLKKSIHFPKLKNIQTFQGTIIDIRKHKAYLNRLIEKIEKTSSNNV